MAGMVMAISMSVRNGTFQRDWAFLSISMFMIVGYGTVGAFVTARTSGNPIGWLMITVAGAFVLAGFSDEYASYAYVTEPGSLPGASFALWLSNWVFIGVVAPIPFILLLFPNGRLPSRRWRPFAFALAGLLAAGALGTILRPGIVEFEEDSTLTNPTGVEALGSAIDVVLWVVGIGGIVLSLLSVVALVQRFRTASGEERQQIRWLAYVAALCGVALVVAIVSGFGLGPDESNALNNAAFFAFFALLGIGMPVAIGVALLKYRLWDLDLVVQKAVVATVVITAFTVLSVVVLLLLSGLVVGPISDRPELTLLAGLAIGALLWPILRLSRRVADRVVYGGRATPYEVLTDFSGRMAEAYSTEDVLPRMAGIVGAGASAERVGIWLLVGREMIPAAGWPTDPGPDEPRPMTELPGSDPGTFEVRHQGELLGAVTVRMPANDPMNPSKERLIRDLASQAGLVLRNVRLIEELRASRRRLVAAQDAERRRVERNIHDGAQQQLVALAVKLRLAEQVVEKDPGKAREILAQLQTQAGETLEDLRDLARGIYPPLLADEGLAAAVQAQARKISVPVDLRPDGVARYDQEVEAAAYFCVLEALQNITKYASASTVRIALEDDGERLTFTVSDDGAGFDRGATTRGTGLQGMADRMDAVGGSLEVISAPGQGTTVLGHIPVR